MKRTQAVPRRRPEALAFRLLLMKLRDELEWTQDALAERLGVSRKTLSNWEQGYWLPPFKQRLHVVLALRSVPPEWVLDIADALGVSVDPAVAPLLQPFRDALQGTSNTPPLAASTSPLATSTSPAVVPAAPPPPRPSPEQLRAAADAAIRDAADALNARPNEVRAAVAQVLGACAALGATLDEALASVAARGIAPPKPA